MTTSAPNFKESEKTRSVLKKKALLSENCSALRVYAQIEDEVFYPALMAPGKNKLMAQTA